MQYIVNQPSMLLLNFNYSNDLNQLIKLIYEFMQIEGGYIDELDLKEHLWETEYYDLAPVSTCTCHQPGCAVCNNYIDWVALANHSVEIITAGFIYYKGNMELGDDCVVELLHPNAIIVDDARGWWT